MTLRDDAAIREVGRNPDDCWPWPRRKRANGYGRVMVNGREMYAHRASYEHHIGPIPKGLTLDHLCRNPSCVNPAHLEPVTLAENIKRAWAALTPEEQYARTAKAGSASIAARSPEAMRRWTDAGAASSKRRAAERAKRKTCVNGHPWTKASTYVEERGNRTCRICTLASQHRRRARIRVGVLSG